MAFLREYENLGELGKVGGGSFAQVYKVRHNELGYVRAIRVLKNMITDENSKEYKDFLKECKFLLRLGNSGHPNIVRIYQPRLIENKAFWEMDYIEGNTVEGFIEQCKGLVPVEDIKRFLLDISSALAYCHVDNYWFSLSRDDDRDLISTDPSDGSKLIISDENRKKLIAKYAVVHNDIKSNNIMRKFDGSYILLDFGLSFGTDNKLSRSSLMNNGGIEYKAPEKWDCNKEEMTERTDIYSFGIVLYEMLTGRVPFPCDSNFSMERNIFNVSEHHKNSPVPAIEPLRRAAFEAANTGKTYTKDYPEWLEKVIMKCLEKKPENRYVNGKELFEEVKAHIEKDAQDAFQNKTVEKNVYVDKPVEKTIEKPVEKIVEKIVYVENTVPKTADIPNNNDGIIEEPKRFSWKKTILWSVIGLLAIVLVFGMFGFGFGNKAEQVYEEEQAPIEEVVEETKVQHQEQQQEERERITREEQQNVTANSSTKNTSTTNVGVVKNGVRWAEKNVGAWNIEDYGNYYTWENAKTACPKGWRLPTEAELGKLVNTSSVWTTKNGIYGRKFGNIFLPAAGSGTLEDVGSAGNYWSSTQSSYDERYDCYWISYLNFSSSNVQMYVTFYKHRFSVRCVAE